ncbi:MAG: hypothetical protein ACOCQ4_01250 [bacterium]
MDITQEIETAINDLQASLANVNAAGWFLLIGIILIIIVLAFWIGRSGGTKPSILPEPEHEGSLIRNFDWIFETVAENYPLSIEVKVSKSSYQEAQSKLITGTPNKTLMYSTHDCFDIAKFEILHKSFGAYSPEVKQIAEYLKDFADTELLSKYEFAKLILSFVHENPIRYSYDENSTGYPEYFRFPLETIVDKEGDCDCKAILACALYKYLGYEVAFLILPGHAAIAVGFEQELPFTNLYFKGLHWYYAESTGDHWVPGQLPYGIGWNNIEIMRLK